MSHVLMIVNMLLEDVAEDPSRLLRAQEIAKRDLSEAKLNEIEAARYRWLRNDSPGQFDRPIVVSQKRVERGMQYIGPLCGEALDKAIDAAISSRDAASSISTKEKS